MVFKRNFVIYILLISFLTMNCVSANELIDNCYDNGISVDSNLQVNFNDSVVYDVHSSLDFLNLADSLADYNNSNVNKNVTINLDSGKTYQFDSNIKDTHLKNRIFDDYGFVMKVNGFNLIINGNGAIIKNTDEYNLGFLYVCGGDSVSLNNVNLRDFKLGCVNEGIFVSNNCNFTNNVNSNILSSLSLFNQEGGVLHNYGTATFNKDIFDSNDAKHDSGAVFADSNSKTFLFDCIYKKENDNVYVADDAFVFINMTSTDQMVFSSRHIIKKSERSSVCIKSLDISNYTFYEADVRTTNEFINALIKPHYNTWGIKINLYSNVYLPKDLLIVINEPVKIISFYKECMGFINGESDTSFLINKQGSLTTEYVVFVSFNTVFENHGMVCCNGSYFNKNGMVIENWGGSFHFTNCDFTNLKLGSIYSEGKTISYIVNCTFKNGEGLSVWEKIVNAIASRWETQDVNVYSIDSKIILVNSICSYKYDADKGGIISKRNNLDPIITYLIVNDSKSLHDAANKVWKDNGRSDQIIINFTNSNTISIDYFDGNLFHPRFTTLILNGQGNIIKAINNDDNDLFKFLYVEKNCYVYINNLTISKFNTAILNYGVCIITNSILRDNRIDTLIKEDYGGAIDNRGNLICINCIFTNNYAKYGGAIYNLGYCQVFHCTFKNNDAYRSNCNDIYNRNSAFCNLINSTCKDINNCYGMSKLAKDLIISGTQLACIALSFSFGALWSTAGLGNVFGLIIGTVFGSTVGIIGIQVVATDSQNWNGWDVSKQIFNTVITSLIFSASGVSIASSTNAENNIQPDVSNNYNGESSEILINPDDINFDTRSAIELHYHMSLEGNCDSFPEKLSQLS